MGPVQLNILSVFDSIQSITIDTIVMSCTSPQSHHFLCFDFYSGSYCGVPDCTSAPGDLSGDVKTGQKLDATRQVDLTSVQCMQSEKSLRLCPATVVVLVSF